MVKQKRFPPKVVTAMIKDETEASKWYQKRGLPQFAKDERKHLNYWKEQQKKQKR